MLLAAPVPMLSPLLDYGVGAHYSLSEVVANYIGISENINMITLLGLPYK